jgi:hypothetical protein
MTPKMVEIRDAATFIPALAVKLEPVTPQDRYLLLRAGYSPAQTYVQLIRLAGGNGQGTCDPEDWDSLTMQHAHVWLIEHFDEIESGAVVDVEFIRGLRATPKRSECSEWETPV